MKFHRYLSIGRYSAGTSPVHRADPRAKLLLAVAFASTVFLSRDWRALGLLACCPLAGLLLARVPAGLVLGNLRGLWLVFLMTLLFTAGSGEGEVWYGEVESGLYLTREGFMHGLQLCAQLGIAITAFGLMTATTTVFETSAALERLGAPLARLGLPVADFAMMLALAVRFFPVLTEETETVMRAQIARGAPLERGNPALRLRATAAVLLPVFIRTFRHANDMAVAMECRLYGCSPQPTLLNPLRWRFADTITLLAAATILLPLLLFRFS